MNRALLALLVSMACLGATACRTTRAETPVERPNLDVPPPPPRVIEPAPVEPPPEPVADPPATTPALPAPKPKPSAPSAPKPEAKPETPTETPPPVAAAPPTQLRTPGMPEGPEAERQIRGILNRAEGMLKKTDYRTLPRERKTSYDTAMRFLQEGDRELRAANYVLAKELAEKAEKLAKELQSR